jgi:hypothetical protein
LILPLVQFFPTKPLEREILCCVAKQLSFFIFPPTRIHRKHQKHLIKRAKKFQEGPPKQKSFPEKDHQTQFFHKFGDISKESKVLTSEMKHRVKTHRITPAVDNERGDIEINRIFILTVLLRAPSG